MILQVLNKLTADKLLLKTTLNLPRRISSFSLHFFQFSIFLKSYIKIFIKWLINQFKHSQTLGTPLNFRSIICNLPFIFLCFFYTIWYLSKLHRLCSKFNLCSTVIIIKEKHRTIVVGIRGPDKDNGLWVAPEDIK